MTGRKTMLGLGRTMPALHADHQNVAVYGKKVVDHDSSLSKLLNRVGKSYPRDRVVVEYVTRKKRELIL